MSAPADLRLGVVQCAGASDGAPEEWIARAGARGVHLLVLPELFPCGYGAPDVAGRAERRDGEFAARVADGARASGVAVVYGYPERSDDGTLHNAAQLVDADGTSVAHYRKNHLFGPWERATFRAATLAPPVVSVRGFGVAIMICYDVEFPEFVRAAVLDGADVVVVPTANPTGYETVQRLLVPARALENQCVVAYANYHRPGFGGLSTVAGPDGGVLAAAGAHEDALLEATVTRAALDSARADQCYLDDRRPASYASVTAPVRRDATGTAPSALPGPP